MPDDDLQITEQDLICFFESAHVSRVYGDDWYDSDSVYEKKFDTGMTVTFALHPSVYVFFKAIKSFMICKQLALMIFLT